jgi:hypothetical protein
LILRLIFAHETPAFVLQSSDYGVAGTNHANTNQSWPFVSRLPSRTPSGAPGVNQNGIKQVCS